MVPGCATSPRTPKSAYLPSRSPRYAMSVRSTSKSRLPVSGSWVVMAHRASGLVTFITALPIATRFPIQVSSSCGPVSASSMSIRKRRGSTASTPPWRASSASEPSDTMLVGLPLRVPPGRSQRTRVMGRPQNADSASAQGPRTTCPMPVRPWIGVSIGSPRVTSSSRTRPSGNVSRRVVPSGSVCAAIWTSPGTTSRSTSRFVSSARKNRRSSATPSSVTEITAGCSRPRLRTGAIEKRVTVGIRGCYRTATSRGARSNATSGTHQNESRGSGRGAPPRCPSSGCASCRAGR